MFVVIAIYLHILLHDTIAAASDRCPVVGRLSQGEEQGENDPSPGTHVPSFLPYFLSSCFASRLLLPPLPQCAGRAESCCVTNVPSEALPGGQGRGEEGLGPRTKHRAGRTYRVHTGWGWKKMPFRRWEIPTGACRWGLRTPWHLAACVLLSVGPWSCKWSSCYCSYSKSNVHDCVKHA